jgi:serine/threonine protein kinase
MSDSEHPASAEKSRSERLEELIALYLDRLNSGETLDPRDILAEHPGDGHEIIKALHQFLEFGEESGGGPEDRSATDVRLGTLGDYTLRRQIGRGGMGVVYEAWQHSMDRRVALKVLPAGVAADRKSFVRFMREAQTAGQLSHQNVVAVYSTGVEEGTPWYSMEYVEGQTLAQVLRRARQTDADTGDAETPFGKREEQQFYLNLAKAMAEVAEGLQHAHSRGVIHRDIKPSNLILDRNGCLRILDFGLARLEGQESLTSSGDFVGTPLYMSPEQARRRKIPIDHRTDVYSLGATVYEMLTLRPPFQGKDHQDTLSQIIERDPREPRKLNPRVPRDLETIALKCLRKDLGDRYGTAEALAQDLRRFVRGDPIEARPQATWERLARRMRRQRTALLAAAVFVLLGGLAGWLAYRSLESERARRLAEYPRVVGEAVEKLSSGAFSLEVGQPARGGPLRLRATRSSSVP